MKRFFISLFFITIFINLSAQVSFKDALIMFEQEQYSLALKQFLRLYKSTPEDVDLNYYIALTYIKGDEKKSEALQYLEKIKKNKTAKHPKDIDYQLAIANFHSHKFDQAKTIFLKYKEDNRETIKIDEIKNINRYIENCDNAIELIKNPVNVIFVNLGDNINSKYSEYNPYVTEDGQQLVYTSNKKYISEFQELIHNSYWSIPNYEIENTEWTKMKTFGKNVNTDSYEDVVGISQDANKVFINLKGPDSENDIFITNKDGRKFTELQDLTTTINSPYIEDGACFSFSEDTIYFASDRPGGFGGFDLYISVHLPDGSWGIPQNLGKNINSTFDENYPHISYDGSTLYFASTGFNSMGGYDVFSSNKIANDWATPKNLGYPINDTYDNQVISVLQNKRYAYMSKVLDEGLGCSDIYKVIFKDVPAPSLVFTGTILVGKSYKAEPLEKYNEDIEITVKNNATGEILDGFTYNKTTKKYVVALKPGKYTINIKGDKYLPLTKEIKVFDVQPTEIVTTVDLFLQLKP